MSSRFQPRRRLAFAPGLLFALFFGLCAPLVQAQSEFIARNFHVRIAIQHEVEHLAIQGSGAYQVQTSGGKAVANLRAGEPYFIEITRGRPGDRTYRLVLREMNGHQVSAAIALAKQAKDRYQMAVKVLRQPAASVEESLILVTMGEFTSLDSARRAAAKLPGEKITHIYEDRSRAREGQVRLLGRDRSILAHDEKFLKIVPFNLAEDSLAVRQGRAESSGEVSFKESRRYRGEMELTINEEGTLTAVNDLWIEYYLYSVVGAEIGMDAPDEAFKAQAVAARSEAVAKIQRGILSSSFFDFYDTPMCQFYPGKKWESARVRAAVDATRGEILISDGQPVDAVYSHCCGGVVASSQDMWDGENEDYCPRQLDRLVSKACPDLTDWSAARSWTANHVDALCDPNQPGFPKYGHKYYRWNKVMSGEEFSRLANRMYGVGDVRDVIVERRTPSGRVRRIKIIGDRKSATVKRELEIRNALGEIYSNFFTFTKEHNGQGRLTRLTINGGGYGHGVGLCQMGAYMMGVRGYNYRQILAHYYNGVKIRRLYR